MRVATCASALLFLFGLFGLLRRLCWKTLGVQVFIEVFLDRHAHAELTGERLVLSLESPHQGSPQNNKPSDTGCNFDSAVIA
eukprot:m.468678 g.468678  ORF g.468678 m.468678 type:complete len:82 (-) comp27726_c0_seq1:1058-1303(-)